MHQWGTVCQLRLATVGSTGTQEPIRLGKISRMSMRRARLLVRKRNGEQRPKETKLRLGYADQILAAVATPLNNKLAVVGNDGTRALPVRLRWPLPAAAHALSWRFEEMPCACSRSVALSIAS